VGSGCVHCVIVACAKQVLLLLFAAEDEGLETLNQRARSSDSSHCAYRHAHCVVQAARPLVFGGLKVHAALCGSTGGKEALLQWSSL
jgi:hypothetical protein